MAWYRTGTIALTNGSTAVVGTGTDFVAGAAVGESVVAPDGKVYEIAAVVSATSLTLGSNYLGTTASGQAYAIAPTQSYIRDLAGQAAALINTYSGLVTNAAAGKFPDGTLSVPSIRFTTDDNTGINHLTSDSFDLVTNGVSRLNVSNSGLSGDATGLSNTIAPQTVAATSKTTPVDADLIPLVDSAASNVLKKLTWANLKATAKTYFDTLYLGIAATAANASQLLGKTWAAPDPIGSGTPNTGAFTTLSATGTGATGLALLRTNATDTNAGANTPTLANSYLNLGGGEYGADKYYPITFGYSAGRTNPAAYVAYRSVTAAGYGYGDIVIGVRSVSTDTLPTTVATFSSTGLAVTGAVTTSTSFKGTRASGGSVFPLLQYGDTLGGAVSDNVVIGNVGGDPLLIVVSNVERARVTTTGLAVSGAVTATSTMNTGGYTVATLPAGSVGDRAYVTDATAPTFLGALTGGGAVRTPVFKNASAWVAG